MPAPNPGPPVWLLDIDGVINALGMSLPTDTWPESAWVQRVVTAVIPEQGMGTYPILAARPVLDFIHRVHRNGLAEIRWHSTWRSAAVTGLAPALGLPAIPISVAPEWSAAPPVWWKIPAARRVAESGRRLLWTDDQFDLYRADPQSASELEALERWTGALLLSANPETGLSPDDLATIERFLEPGRGGCRSSG
ncbi:MAG: hypothetical protein ACRDWT_19170 [Jatrophihabitantaceae bacterium]